MNRNTDARLFEPRLLCVGCGLDLATYDESTPASACRHEHFEPENLRRFLPGADAVPDILLSRTPVGGLREASGAHLGDALVSIEQRLVYHSPTGFEWGYGGSGPADLALNILALFVAPPEAWRLHQKYKFAVIGSFPREGGVITASSVRAWILAAWEAA